MMRLVNLFSRQLLVLTGKGGVGRTTLAAALAMLAARQGKRVLIAQTKSSHRLGPLFGVSRLFNQIEPVRENIWAVNMQPEVALAEYGTMVLRSEFLYRQIFERDVAKALLRSIPGVLDYAMLGKVWYHTTEEDRGRRRFDLVILDAPATGHALTLLRLPQTILQALPRSPLSASAQACYELLTDSLRCLAPIITLAEELPVHESLQLNQGLASLKIQPGVLVVNRLYSTRFEQCEGKNVLDAIGRQVPASLMPVVAAAQLQQERASANAQYVKQLRERLPLPQLHVPYVFAPTFGLKEVEELVTHLEALL